jgi:hypothetical protein
MRSIHPLVALLLLLFTAQTLVNVASAWSNGGYSSNPSNPDYGTHDWIAEHAKNWLPAVEWKWIDDNLNCFLYGTEYPDNSGASYGTTRGYGDTTKHHNYYDSSGFAIDASAAMRATEEYAKALSELKAGRNDTAAIYAGSMTHYIADVAVFGHVMTGETHHSDYEDYVGTRTTSYSYGVFESYLIFDGKLENVSAYDASISLGWDTFNDKGGTYTASWMDTNYNWDNPAFKNRCGESLNLATNYVADVLHMLYIQAKASQSTSHIIVNEVEQNPSGTDAGYEWIELYNPTSNIVDISGWTASTTAGVIVTLRIPSGTRIPTGGYYVVTYSSQWLDNEGESVILRDSSGNEVDRTPSLSDTYNDDRSWQRYPNGRDTDSVSDWSFRWSTKGASNGGEVVEKKPTTISCGLSKSTITKGETVTISGAINVSVSGSVTIQVSTDNELTWNNLSTVTSASDGRYSCTWTPSTAGTYSIRATWSGDLTYIGATSPKANLTVNEPVTKILTTISCLVSPTELSVGTTLIVSGAITPTRSEVTVTLTYILPNGTMLKRTAITTSDGKYSDAYTPLVAGSFNVKASWDGDTAYEGASSQSVYFTVTKISSTISCKVSSSSFTIGGSVTVSGSISPSVSEKTVTLTYTKPDGSTFMRTATTGADGSYRDSFKPTDLGSWGIQATWDGNTMSEGASSSRVSFTVSMVPSTVSCSLSSSSLTIGDSVTISGSIIPARAGVPVNINYRSDSSWSTLTNVLTASDGSFSYFWTPTSVGSYQLKASWEGDAEHEGASSLLLSFSVEKISTTISASLSKTTITEGDEITVSGTIQPAPGSVSVTLTYKKPDGATMTRTVTSTNDGTYTDTFKPTPKGSWSVTASWKGSETYEGTTSTPASFTVEEKKGCIVATATYGSELSPEVQFLRGFRDNYIQYTFAGKNFMAVFNAWYYSFSPSVAAAISAYDAIRGFMKILLYPLIGILHLSSITYSLFGFNPEFAVVASGLVASSLIGITYISPIALILCLVKKANISNKVIRAQSLIWAISMGSIVMAEIIQSQSLMMLSTALFVLSTMSLAVLYSVKYIRIFYTQIRRSI